MTQQPTIVDAGVRAKVYRATNHIETGITLVAGLASTVGWPLSMWMVSQWGWRGARWAWARLRPVVGLPLNAWTPRRSQAKAAVAITAPPHGAPASAAGQEPVHTRRASLLLAFVFGARWITSTAMAARLPCLLQEGSTTLATTMAVGAPVGAPGGRRLLEFGFLRHVPRCCRHAWRR